MSHLPVICLMGPTAVGKSQLAIDLANALPCDIISVDSVMVYRGMDIGTAKPDQATLSCTPHQLVDIREPFDPYSAGDFFRDVQNAIQNSFEKHRIPLLIGGTMLYFNTLRKGLADLPLYSDHPNYAQLKAELDSMDESALYSDLKKYDPLSADRLHTHDRQRIQRALLIYHLSKSPLSALHQTSQRHVPYSMLWMAVYPESRQKLREIIATRFQSMLLEGLIEETNALYQKPWFSMQLPACRAVGYRQVIEYLNQEITLDELKIKGVTATCQLAKRQLTWLRSWPELNTLYAHEPHLLAKAKQLIEAQCGH